MKLILFLGSGVSLDSGLPSVMALTKSLFTGRYHQDGFNHFSPGAPTDPQLQAIDHIPRIRGLLRLLKHHDDQDLKRVGYSPTINRSTGAIYRGEESTYEDLFYLCEQIKLWNIGLVDNSLVTPLMEKLEHEARGLLTGNSIMERLSDLGSLAEQGSYFIESVVAGELCPQDAVGLDLIIELVASPLITDLTIVTLNHDTLVEQFLTEKGVDFVDGFGERDGDVRWYDESVYDSAPTKTKILKLHGSVNWYTFLANGKSLPAIFMGPDITKVRDENGADLKPLFRRPSFLSGIDKAVAYQRGIYADMHFRFHWLLRECNQMVVSGYGWGDTAMNFRLETWLDQSSNNKLILLHERPEDLVDRSLILASGYDHWSRTGQLSSVRKWLSQSSLLDLNDLGEFGSSMH